MNEKVQIVFRFHAESKENDSFSLSKDTLKHIKVARANKEHFIIIWNEEFYECKLFNDTALILEKLNIDNECKGELIVAPSLINTKRFEWLIQKATELGATRLIPIISENVSNKISGDINKKVARWNEIAKNASEQSFRNKSMIVEKPMKFEDALNTKIENKYIAYTSNNEDVKISFPTNSIFFIGPEGGFEENEVKLAIKNKFEVISLGKRILRAETASIFCLSRVN